MTPGEEAAPAAGAWGAGAGPGAAPVGGALGGPDPDGLWFDVVVSRGSLVVAMAGAVRPGGRLAVVGPSGAGKSTVLAALAGLVPLARGAVWLHGRMLSCGARRGGGASLVPVHRRRLGLVAQQPGLFPHLDVAANIGFGLPGGRRHPRVTALAEAFGIADLLASRPARCSGGQRQRVALARALAPRPDAVLLDEPFSALDPALRAQVVDVVDAELASGGAPAVLVTHDLLEAQAWGDELAVVDAGRCLQVGPPGVVVATPGSRRVAELVGYGPAVAAGSVVAHPGPPPAAAAVMLHPEATRLAATGGGRGTAGAARTGPAVDGADLPDPDNAGVNAGVAARGTVTRLHAAGAALRAEVALDGGGTMPVPVPAGAPVPAAGAAVTVVGAHAAWFDVAGRRVPWGTS